MHCSSFLPIISLLAVAREAFAVVATAPQLRSLQFPSHREELQCTFPDGLPANAPELACEVEEMVCPYSTGDAGQTCSILDAETGLCVPMTFNADCLCQGGLWRCRSLGCTPCTPTATTTTTSATTTTTIPQTLPGQGDDTPQHSTTCPTPVSSDPTIGGLTLSDVNKACDNVGESCPLSDATCAFWDNDSESCLHLPITAGCACQGTPSAWICIIPNCQPCTAPVPTAAPMSATAPTLLTPTSEDGRPTGGGGFSPVTNVLASNDEVSSAAASVRIFGILSVAVALILGSAQ